MIRQIATIVATLAIALTALATEPAPALAAGCASWDVRAVCCPAGCAARRGPNWSHADDVLRACMRGLGCTDVAGATVFMACDCREAP